MTDSTSTPLDSAPRSPARTSNPRGSVPGRVAAAFFACFFALSLTGWVGEQFDAALGTRLRYILQAVVVTAIVIPFIGWLRTRRDGHSMASAGIPVTARAAMLFGLGLALVALPIALTAAVTTAMGWGTVSINLSQATLLTLGTGLVTVFLSESLPEELVFRGYIFHKLNTAMSRRAAGAATVALFVIFPVLFVPFQRYVLQMDISIGGASSITGGYLVTMVVFGSFTQYMRVLTGNVWMGVGFHLAFVLMNRVVGPRPDALVHFSEQSAAGPIQSTVILSLLSIVGILLAWPRMSGRRLQWGEHAAA